jgi:heat shock protein HspQ
MDATKFNLGDIVYHRVSEEKGIVTGIMYRPHGVVYYVTWDHNSEGAAWDVELSSEKILSV